MSIKKVQYWFNSLWISLLAIITILLLLVQSNFSIVEQYQFEIKSWLITEHQLPIEFTELHSVWNFGEQPHIVIQDFYFEKQTSQFMIHGGEIAVYIDVWQSLIKQQLILKHFALRDFNIELTEQFIREQINNNAPTEFNLQQQIREIFLEQLQYFVVEQSEIHIRLNDQTVETITIKELNWYNNQPYHQGEGRVIFNHISNENLNLAINLTTNSQDNLSGTVYLSGSHLPITNWLRENYLPNLDMANVNFKSWWYLDKDRWQQGVIELGETELAWYQEQQSHYAQIQPHLIKVQPSLSGWQFYSEAAQIRLDRQMLTPVSWQLVLDKKSVNFYSEKINISDWFNFTSLFPLDTTLEDELVVTAPQGQLNEIFIRYDQEKQLQLSANFSDISWRASKKLPGITGLSGHWGWNNNHGWLTVDSNKIILTSPNLWPEPLQLTQIQLDLSVHQDQEQWHIYGHEFWLDNQDLALGGEFILHLEETPRLDIYAELFGPEITVAKNYFPVGIMGEKLTSFLSSSLQKGELNNTQFLLQGLLADFPYKNNQGHFQIISDVTQGQFKFQPDWPAVKELEAQLIFDNDGLLITATSGKLEKLIIDGQKNQVQTTLMPLSALESVLVDIDLTTEASNVNALFQQTPLHNSLGEVLKQVVVNEVINGQVRLDINTSDNELREAVIATGIVNFNDNTVWVDPIATELTKVNGQLTFVNEQIELNTVNLQLGELPLTLKVLGKNKEAHYKIGIMGENLWTAKQLFTQYPYVLSDEINGNLPFTFNFDLTLFDEGFTYKTTIDADLASTEINLPAPYNKPKSQPAALSIQLNGNTEEHQLSINSSHRISFNSLLRSTKERGLYVKQANLNLGDQKKFLLDDEFTINVDLPEINYEAWYPIIQKIINYKGTGGIDFPKLSEVSGDINRIDFYGRPLQQANFELKPQAENWELLLNSKQTKMALLFAENWKDKGITIQADYLYLHDTEETYQQEPFTLTDDYLSAFPAITFYCADCKYNGHILGEIEGKVNANTHNIRGIAFNNFTMQYKGQSLFFDAFWRKQDNSTEISGEFNSRDFNDFLKQFSMSSSIRDSKAKAQFSFNWLDAPYNFSVAKLNGDINWRLDDGHIAELSDKGTRIFSLLSLDTVLRRLKLDFRDVFSKGLFYNKVTADMTVKQGVVSTDNLQMDALSGNLLLQGSTDLVSKTIDYELAFQPKLTSSLPVIIAFMVNPLSGLATLALDQVIEKADVITEVKFALNGTIDNPEITELERKSKQITVPKDSFSQIQ